MRINRKSNANSIATNEMNNGNTNNVADHGQPIAMEIPLGDRIRSDIEQLLARNAELETKLAESKAVLAWTKEELAGTKAVLAGTEEELAWTKEKLAGHKQQNTELKDKVKRLEAEKQNEADDGGEGTEDGGEEDDGSENDEKEMDEEEEENTDGEDEGGDGEEVPPTNQSNDGNAQKRFQCPQCAYSSNRKSNMINHERTHTGERPFKCHHEGCNYATTQASRLKIHERIHTGEKPYECHRCPSAFVEGIALRRHEKRMHRIEKEHKYRCYHDGCRYSSDSKAELFAHKRRCHR